MKYPPPPWNQEAEAGLIGCVLTSNASLPWLREHVKTHHFHRAQHRTIWAAICEMHDLDRSIDTVTVTAHLHRTRQLKAAGGKAVLDGCLCGVSLAAVKDYARIVVDAWCWRVRLRIAYEQLSAVGEFDEARWARAVARLSDPRLAVSEPPKPNLRMVEGEAA